MKKIYFQTPTRISLLDITTMGDSVKRDDDSKIGTYDSGLKYTIALFLRNNVDITITTKGEPIIHDNWEEITTVNYYFDSFVKNSDTGKTKELIRVTEEIVPHGGIPQNSYDLREPSLPTSIEIPTAFAKNLGFNWDLWMGLREVYSNMLDEGGFISDTFPDLEDFEGTVVTLTFSEDSEFGKIWENKHLYINDKELKYKISNSVYAFENQYKHIRIYKNHILVYENENIPSRFSYDISFGEIDERRILQNPVEIEREIAMSIKDTKNEDFLRVIISSEFIVKDNEFLTSNISAWWDASDLIHEIALETQEKEGKVDSYSWLISSIRKRKDCKIGGKVITTVQDSLWGYSTPVTIETIPIESEKEKCSIKEEIERNFNIDLNICIKTAKLKGNKVVADKYEKCLIVDDNFSIEENMPEFIVQYIDLTQKGNIITNLSKYICELIKR